MTVRELEHDLGSSITLSCLNIVGHVSTSIGPSSGFNVNVRRFSVTSPCCYYAVVFAVLVPTLLVFFVDGILGICVPGYCFAF